jgi:hypothetical protein
LQCLVNILKVDCVAAGVLCGCHENGHCHVAAHVVIGLFGFFK